MMRLKSFIFLLGLVAFSLKSPALMASETQGKEAGAEAEGGEEHGFNWFDFSSKTPPLIALLANFAALVFLVYIILRKPLGERFKNRKQLLETELEEASKLKEEAKIALAQARERMESIDAEMAKIKQDILDAGKAESIKILEEAKAMSERIGADAIAMVEQELALLTNEIRREIVEEIVELAKKIVLEKINALDHERLFQDYLSGIETATEQIASHSLNE